ncbi:MAG TPA: universal stress protein, partial [Candidatus Binataceae bacterium]|nr:universal stress protein [Candidatus Binataceae bacterium]
MHRLSNAIANRKTFLRERRRQERAMKRAGRDSRHPPPAEYFREGTPMNAIQKRRILCPIEFDVNSLAALDMARDMIRERNGSLFVLHVVPPTSPFIISAPLLSERARHFARIELEEIARESLSDVDHHLLVKTGRPADEIIATANELKPQMVVMATHGRTGAPRFFLGSVTEK